MEIVEDQNDKLFMTTPCEIVRNGRAVRGKLYIFGKRITFCSMLVYSMHVSSDPKKHMLTIRMYQIESVQLFASAIHITSKKRQLVIFRSTQQPIQEVFNLLESNFNEWKDHVFLIKYKIEAHSEAASQFNEAEEQLNISRISSKGGWFNYRRKVENYIQQLMMLKKDHVYGKPQTLLLSDLSIQEIFSTLFSDKPYRPSMHMTVGKTRVGEYQCPLHYFLEDIVGDKNLQATTWSPQAPEYLSGADKDYPPMIMSIADLPQRQVVLDHPTKLPFFGEVMPQITMTQKLLLVDQNEFWIFNTTQITKMVYSENYLLKGYYKIQEVKPKEFYIESRECVEWNRKLLIVSGQVDQAAAKENDRMFNNFMVPFMNARRDELIKLREEERKSSILLKKESSILIPENKNEQENFPIDEQRNLKELQNQITDLKKTIKSTEDHLLKKMSKYHQQQTNLIKGMLVFILLLITIMSVL